MGGLYVTYIIPDFPPFVNTLVEIFCPARLSKSGGIFSGSAISQRQPLICGPDSFTDMGFSKI